MIRWLPRPLARGIPPRRAAKRIRFATKRTSRKIRQRPVDHRLRRSDEGGLLPDFARFHVVDEAEEEDPGAHHDGAPQKTEDGPERAVLKRQLGHFKELADEKPQESHAEERRHDQKDRRQSARGKIAETLERNHVGEVAREGEREHDARHPSYDARISRTTPRVMPTPLERTRRPTMSQSISVMKRNGKREKEGKPRSFEDALL